MLLIFMFLTSGRNVEVVLREKELIQFMFGLHELVQKEHLFSVVSK